MIADRIKTFKRVNVTDLIDNPRNWRKHPDAQRNALGGLLESVGWADAVLARETDDGLMLIDGHLRKELADDSKVPVLVLDVTEAEADLILATHDPLTSMAETDQALLDELVKGLDIDNEETQKLLDELVSEPLRDLVEDELPELPENPTTKLGDLFELGRHRLLCGDATSADDVNRLLDGGVPFIMVTDPPYGVNYYPKWRLDVGLNKPSNTRAEGVVENDDNASWKTAWDLFPGVVAYVWHGALNSTIVGVDLMDSKFDLRSQIIWVKPSLVISRGHYHWRHEPCWYGSRGTAKWSGDRKQSTCWDIPNMHRTQGDVDDGKTSHGTQKPLECMLRPIKNHGSKDDDVYDPFLGSGTTMIAAEQLGRKCYGMEISPAYCDMIIQRWENLTGKKAKKVK